MFGRDADSFGTPQPCGDGLDECESNDCRHRGQCDASWQAKGRLADEKANVERAAGQALIPHLRQTVLTYYSRN